MATDAPAEQTGGPGAWSTRAERGDPWVTRVRAGRDPARRRMLRVDALVAGGVTATWLIVVTLALQWDYWRPAWFESYWLAGFGLVLPLVLRRTAPGAALLVTAASYPLLYTWWVPAGLQSPFHVLPLMVAAFFAARAGRSGFLVGPAAVLGTLLLVGGPLDRMSRPGTGFAPSLSVNEILLLVSLVAAATVLGVVLGRLDRSLASLAQRNRELEELQQVRTREAVQSERVRIARDLHDVVAHHVSAIVVRAQAAERVGGDDVELYRDAVGWIAPEGRQALDAMRSLVRVLREDAPPLAPTSTLAELVAVVARMRGAGLELETVFPERWPACSPAVGLAVVRVAQEALTNVVSHSAAAGAVVRVEASPDRLVLEVEDAGPARASNRGGSGLVHMTERAAACGGALSAGPVGDGWRVRMEVPLGARGR